MLNKRGERGRRRSEMLKRKKKCVKGGDGVETTGIKCICNSKVNSNVMHVKETNN